MTNDEVHGVVGGITSVSNKLIGSLPAQFLVLCLLNALFLGAVLWFLNNQASIRATADLHASDVRERVLQPILDACLKHVETKP